MGTFNYDLVKDPTYFNDNRVAAHSDHKYYASVEAMEQDVDNFRHSLNGLWKFHYARNYNSTIPGFEKTEYCCKSWDDIRVPAHIHQICSGWSSGNGIHQRTGVHNPGASYEMWCW